MMVVFGQDVGQCVLGMDSSAQSIMACPLVWSQERVDSGEIRTENERESVTRQTST